MRTKFLPLLGLLAVAPTTAPAQTADPEALPPVLTIYREEIKPGRGMAYEKASAAYPSFFAKANPDIQYLGLSSITGDSVALYLEGHPSFAAAEQNQAKVMGSLAQNVALRTEFERMDSLNADLVNNSRSAYFVLRPALSHRPPRMSDVAKARYMAVTTYRIKPGHVPDWNEYVRSLNVAREKAGAGWLSLATYQSQVGAPTGTFVTFRPLRSMADLDDDNAKGDERQKAIDAALGGDQAVKMRRQLVSEILVEAPTTNVYAINRDTSRPSAQFAAFDPDFWKPKAAAVPGKALATKKAEPPKP
jgi:hypothetical protein